MAYELVQNRNAQFAIDWDIVRRILRSYWTAYLQLSYAEKVTMSDSDWYNPMSWSLPDISHLEVDWDTVRSKADANTAADLEKARSQAKYDAAGLAYWLEDQVETAGLNREKFVDWMGTIQTENMHRVNKAVDDYESDIEVAKWVRDTSADGLMVGASVMTGGAALAVTGGASIFKGYAKFQDTGSLGAAAMEGAGSFVFAYVKLGKKFSFKQDMVIALVQAPYKTGTELVGGASVREALLSGSVQLLGPSCDRAFSVAPAKTLFDKVAVPIVITYRGENVTSELLTGISSEIVKRGIEDKGKAFLKSGASDNELSDDQPRRKGQLIDQATLTNKYLLYLGYVNMNNGIGRGW